MEHNNVENLMKRAVKVRLNETICQNSKGQFLQKECGFTEEEKQKAFDMFAHIADMDEKEQKEIYEAISRFLWDGNLTPEEFWIVFANADEDLRRRWFAKILGVTDWFNVVRIFGFETALKYALDDRTIAMLFPEANQTIWKNLKRQYIKYGFYPKEERQ